jgi:hypothetical protein
LHEAGITIKLGHRGLKCTSDSCPTDDLEDGQETDEFSDSMEDGEYPPKESGFSTEDKGYKGLTIIVDSTGVHRIRVQRCTCKDALPLDEQMFALGLFPATFQRVRTAFTFRVLDEFLVENVECKTSAFNFYGKLRRITSNTFPHMVPVSLWIHPWLCLINFRIVTESS